MAVAVAVGVTVGVGVANATQPHLVTRLVHNEPGGHGNPSHAAKSPQDIGVQTQVLPCTVQTDPGSQKPPPLHCGKSAGPHG